jgi:hypothetical protein
MAYAGAQHTRERLLLSAFHREVRYRSGIPVDVSAMSDWQRETTPQRSHTVADPGVFELASTQATRQPPADPGPACVTAAGAEWLASASALPASVHALWRHRPGSPRLLPCGIAFDVVSAPPIPGRRLLDHLWSAGPGTGPVALHDGRVLIFTAPGTAGRIATLLTWEECRQHAGLRALPGRSQPEAPAGAGTFPFLLCHGLGDYVTVPPLRPEAAAVPDRRRGRATDRQRPAGRTGGEAPVRPHRTRWLVAPDLRHPWLPEADVILRACLRSERDRRTPPAVPAGRGLASGEQSILGTADRDARVYDVNRRR